MEFKLLLNFYMIAHFCLILLKLRLIYRLVILFFSLCIAGRRLHTDEIVIWFSFCRFTFRVWLIHLHIHKNFNGGFDILNYCKGVRIFELISLLLQLGFIITINLKNNKQKHITSSLDRILTLKYKSIKASSRVSLIGIDRDY